MLKPTLTLDLSLKLAVNDSPLSVFLSFLLSTENHHSLQCLQSGNSSTKNWLVIFALSVKSVQRYTNRTLLSFRQSPMSHMILRLSSAGKGIFTACKQAFGKSFPNLNVFFFFLNSFLNVHCGVKSWRWSGCRV